MPETSAWSGTVWYTGSGVPSATVGIDGDHYIDSVLNGVYTKVQGLWQLDFVLKGTTGSQGTGLAQGGSVRQVLASVGSGAANTWRSLVLSDITQALGSAVLASESDTLQSVTDRGAVTGQAMTITNTVDSVSVSTGSVRVSGGMGVQGAVYADTMTGHLTGPISGTVYGEVEGDVTGTLSGTVEGFVQGNLFGQAQSVISGIYTTGNYTDPDWLTISASKIGVSTVATTGSYLDLTNRPTAYTLPTATVNTLGGVRPDGVTIGITGSGQIFNVYDQTSYVLPTATTSVRGGVRTDPSTILVTNGVISALEGAYQLPAASTETLGGVVVNTNTGNLQLGSQVSFSYSIPSATVSQAGGIRVDNSSVTIDGTGTISVGYPTAEFIQSDVALVSALAPAVVDSPAMTSSGFVTGEFSWTMYQTTYLISDIMFSQTGSRGLVSYSTGFYPIYFDPIRRRASFGSAINLSSTNTYSVRCQRFYFSLPTNSSQGTSLRYITESNTGFGITVNSITPSYSTLGASYNFDGVYAEPLEQFVYALARNTTTNLVEVAVVNVTSSGLGIPTYYAFTKTGQQNKWAFHPSGRYLYVGHANGEISVYRLDIAGTGNLTLLQNFSTGNYILSSLATHPSGFYLFIAYLDTAAHKQYTIDPVTGLIDTPGVRDIYTQTVASNHICVDPKGNWVAWNNNIAELVSTTKSLYVVPFDRFRGQFIYNEARTIPIPSGLATTTSWMKADPSGSYIVVGSATNARLAFLTMSNTVKGSITAGNLEVGRNLDVRKEVFSNLPLTGDLLIGNLDPYRRVTGLAAGYFSYRGVVSGTITSGAVSLNQDLKIAIDYQTDNIVVGYLSGTNGVLISWFRSAESDRHQAYYTEVGAVFGKITQTTAMTNIVIHPTQDYVYWDVVSSGQSYIMYTTLTRPGANMGGATQSVSTTDTTATFDISPDGNTLVQIAKTLRIVYVYQISRTSPIPSFLASIDVGAAYGFTELTDIKFHPNSRFFYVSGWTGSSMGIVSFALNTQPTVANIIAHSSVSSSGRKTMLVDPLGRFIYLLPGQYTTDALGIYNITRDVGNSLNPLGSAIFSSTTAYVFTIFTRSPIGGFVISPDGRTLIVSILNGTIDAFDISPMTGNIRGTTNYTLSTYGNLAMPNAYQLTFDRTGSRILCVDGSTFRIHAIAVNNLNFGQVTAPDIYLGGMVQELEYFNLGSNGTFVFNLSKNNNFHCTITGTVTQFNNFSFTNMGSANSGRFAQAIQITIFVNNQTSNVLNTTISSFLYPSGSSSAVNQAPGSATSISSNGKARIDMTYYVTSAGSPALFYKVLS